MKTANGMKIMGRAFKRAPRPKATDARGPREIETRRAAEKQRAIARLKRFRKATGSVEKA